MTSLVHDDDAEKLSAQRSNSGFRIYKEKPGMISEEAIWVCICEGYLYTAGTLVELIEVLNMTWKQDRHLVG